MIDWPALRREEFPAVERAVYLNTAGGGPLCRRAAEAARAYYEEASRDGDVRWDAWLERAEAVRRAAARLLGATPEEIAFVGNASTGLDRLAALADGPEGEVVTVAEAFPSVTLPWLARGHRLRLVEPDEDGGWPPERLAESLGPAVRAVAIEHVHYATGHRVDLDAVAAIARGRGVPILVDATQGLGAVPIDVGRTLVDAVVASGYKWLAAGYGIAVLYRRRDAFAGRLAGAGWRTARRPYDLRADRLDPTDEARGLELGHPPFAGIFALGGALELVEEIGLAAIEARLHELTDELHAAMDRLGVPVLSPRAPARRAGITRLGVARPELVARRLAERSILVSARGGGLRVSVHVYNDEGDIDRLAAALGPALADP